MQDFTMVQSLARHFQQHYNIYQHHVKQYISSKNCQTLILDLPVLLEPQVVLTASAQLFQNVMSPLTGHLLFQACGQYMQMYWTSAFISFLDQLHLCAGR